ncbi:MAG TPA: alpha/beta fold hydrolase [Mycobacteriales bacterium]|nr:alpha/beta fold hydrolase [Mycobacteriales bacterium]
MLRHSSPRRRVLIVTSAFVALGVVGVAALAVATRGRPSPPEGSIVATPTDRGDAVPVLLVHGYGGDPTNMSTIASRLRAAGRTVVSVALPLRGLEGIDASAAAVDRAFGSTGADRVDLVGYSLGGVVVRAWVADEHADDVRHVVTIAAPHHGARLAEQAGALDPGRCTMACAELRPGSAFLSRLNAGDETPDGPSWTTLRTALDQTVTPVDSAELDGAVNVLLQDVCADSRVGHGSINRDPLPIGLVLRALDGQLAVSPPPSECAAIRRLGAG